MLETQLLGVTRFEGTKYPTVILRHEDRVLFISIGPFEAAAISWGLGDDKPARPMTHDLILNILAGLRGKLKSITIYNLENQTFFAYLLVEQYDANGQLEQLLRIDTRPSDGIAIAVRAKCPIFVAESVMEQAGQDFALFAAQLENAQEDDLDDEDEEEDEDDGPYRNDEDL